jgi:RNA polymerase sigma-70 factor (ECF subfamily)
MDSAEYEMIRRARQGEESAFKEIIKQHEHRVAATVIGILGNGPEVEDIGQETFIQLYKSLNRFRGDSRLGTYLIRIAINLSFNELKKRKKYYQFQEPLSQENKNSSRSFKDQENAVDIKGLVRQGLQKLSPKFRIVIVLRLIDGYSTRETADILRLPSGTVLSRLARGQAKLKEIVDQMIMDREK